MTYSQAREQLPADMNKLITATEDMDLIATFETPWSASIYEGADGRIVYLSDGWDSETYPDRAAAIAAQNQWTAYADGTEEEQTWAEMGQQIIDALA